MIEYKEDKICNNILILTQEINNAFEVFGDNGKLSINEIKQYELYNDYFFWEDFSMCANEIEAAKFLKDNGISFSLEQVKRFAEFISVLVYILIEADDVSSFYKAGNGLWDFGLWQCDGNIPSLTLQAITLNYAIWEYDNCYLQGGSGWLHSYLPGYREIDDKGYCEINSKCINLYNRIKEALT